MQILFSLTHAIFMFLRSSSTSHCLFSTSATNSEALQKTVFSFTQRTVLFSCFLHLCCAGQTLSFYLLISVIRILYVLHVHVSWMLLVSSFWCISTHCVYFLSICLDILFSLYLITNLFWKGISTSIGSVVYLYFTYQ